MIRIPLLSLIMAALTCSGLNAQFASSLKISKKQHVVGEPVVVELQITNHSGRPQVFANHGRIPWLSLMVRSSNGNPVNARQNTDFGSMRIEPGQTLSKRINIGKYFLLERSGNFIASAIIRPPNANLEGTSTNRVFFEQRAGRIQWAQKIGNAGSKNNIREYRLLRFHGDSSTQLYAQIEDDATGRLLRTVPLGDALPISKPKVSIDYQQHMNILFPHTPVTWLHYSIAPDGKVASRTFHKRTNSGDPLLVTLPNGSIEVHNSIPVDLEAQAKQRSEIRKITDRPTFSDGF